MKLKLYSIISLLVLTFSCQNSQNLNGNYSICQDGEYAEVYFKKDSMRVAKDDYWVKLSDWRKIEIKNDTLHFETFGEWKYNAKAKIKYIGMNSVELWVLDTDFRLSLEPIKENLNFDNTKIFWNGFNNRQNKKDCN